MRPAIGFPHSRQIFLTIGVAFFALWLAMPASAASLDNYGRRLDAALNAVRELDRIDDDGGEDTEIITRRIDNIEQLIPASEEINEGDASIRTDNRWLHEILKEYRLETDHQRRSALLEAIDERLNGLIQQSRPDANGTLRQPGDGDAEKIGEILKRPEFQPPKAAEESLYQKWMREFLEWLQRMFPRAGAPASGIPDMSGLKTGLQILIFTVIAGVIAFLLYRFWPTLWGNGGSRRKRSSQERVILGERIQPDATAVGLFAEAEMLAGSGDIRSAIRKGYISALFELSERDLVRLARYKTNRDYLRDLRRQEKLFLGMSDLTSRFESIWYGSRQAGAPEWQEFKNQYLKTVGGVED